jgi:3-dehydroquinate dehydratase-2
MRIAVLNGPNLNLLGTREPELYGRSSLADIERRVRQAAAELDVTLEREQFNSEGDQADAVQNLAGRADGALINAAAYSHTSLALRDALLAVRVKFVEVHLSNIFARESMRRTSLLADLAIGIVAGFGGLGYELGLTALVSHLRER